MVENEKILFIDCNAIGVAGDMLLGALLDLGVNVERVISAIKFLEAPEFGYQHIDIEIDEVERGEFRATQIDVTSSAHEKHSGTQLIEIVEKAAAGIYMTQKARIFASKVIRTLIQAEADLHKTSFEDSHLHEVALVDTAAEIIGCAVALDDLHLFDEGAKIYSSPLAVGGGLFTFSHGTVSAPAPATLAILTGKQFPFHGGPIEKELATPTGVALLTNLDAEVTAFYPGMVPLKVGFGAGTKNFPEMPAVLRVTLGRATASAPVGDQIAVLETNLDDVTGEVLGYTVEKLLAEGAKDVSIIPCSTKKSRPAHIIKVIADQKDEAHLSEVLISETGTLGVRVYHCQRHIINREVVSVDLDVKGSKVPVRVKISRNFSGEVIKVKPEFEDLKALAERSGKPLRELMDSAVQKAQGANKL
jgi:uncharacterized protein (TIGR00299 family) protein